MRYALAVLACFLSVLSSAEAKQPYEGAWAPSLKNCTEPNDGNFRIAGNKYYGHENDCTIRKVTKTSDEFSLDLRCEGEGEKWNEKVKLVPRGNIMFRNASGDPFVRCKAEPRPPNWPVN